MSFNSRLCCRNHPFPTFSFKRPWGSMNEEELSLMSERLIKKTRVFNHLFTHLRSFISFDSCAAFKSYKMAWDARSTRKTDDAPNSDTTVRLFSIRLCFFVPLLLLAQPQMVSVFLGIYFFSLTCLEHKIDGVYCMWKISTILEKLA